MRLSLKRIVRDHIVHVIHMRSHAPEWTAWLARKSDEQKNAADHNLSRSAPEEKDFAAAFNGR
jgi:hypothetical protein